MNNLNITAELLKEEEKSYLNAKGEFEKIRNEVMSDIREQKNNIEWILEDGEYKCLIGSDLDCYFRWLIENENEAKNDDDLEEIKKAFLNDVKMSVLVDKAVEISKTFGNKMNNDHSRMFFETLSSIEIATNKLGIKGIRIEGLQTNLYLKDIRPFIAFVLLTSKKTGKNLLERFDGFRLVDAKQAKIGEVRTYSNCKSNLKFFFELLRKSKDIDKALCLKFFDTYTNYINIHYLAKAIYAEELRGSDKKILELLEILTKTKIQSPLVKNLLINYSHNIEFVGRPEVLETYASLFEECKESLQKSIFNIKGNRKNTKGTNMSYELGMYKKIYDLFGHNELYTELVNDLINDLIEESEEILDVESYDLEVFKERIFGIKGSYSNTHFGNAYRMIYNRSKK